MYWRRLKGWDFFLASLALGFVDEASTAGAAIGLAGGWWVSVALTVVVVELLERDEEVVVVVVAAFVAVEEVLVASVRGLRRCAGDKVGEDFPKVVPRTAMSLPSHRPE